MPPISVFVGGLGYDVEKEDLEKEFSKFGTLNKVWVARNPPGFSFIEFEDDKDADAAIKEMNGAFIKGCQIHVDLSRGGGRVRGHDGRGRGRTGFDSEFRYREQVRREGSRFGYERSYNREKYEYRNSGFRSRSPMGHRKIVAHFNKPEKELNNALRLDEPLKQGPIPRWESKDNDKSPEVNSTNPCLNMSSTFVNSSANKSTSKTNVKEQALNCVDYPHNEATGGIGNQNILWPDYIDFEDLDYTNLFNTYWYDSSLTDAKKDEEQFSKKVRESKSFTDACCQTEKELSAFENCELITMKNSIEKIKGEFVKIFQIFDKNISNNDKLKKEQKTCVETQTVKKYKSCPNNKNLISIL